VIDRGDEASVPDRGAVNARDLPEAVKAALVRGIGAFARAAEPQQLPPEIRRFRSWRPQALNRHRATLLRALENADFRASVLEWLADGRPPLSPADAAALKVAAEHAEGWAEGLAAGAGEPRLPASEPPDPAPLLAREQERARRARAELRRVKEQSRAAVDAADRRLAQVVRERDELQSSLDDERATIASLQSTLGAAGEDAERRLRRAKRDAERLRSESSALRAELKGVKRRLAAAEAEIEHLRAGWAATSAAPEAAADARAAPPRRQRRALGVPKGRLPEDPHTLDAWLDRGPWLLVDGYNVTKAEGGFGNLSLEAQRERLIDAMGKLATRKQVRATIVFDGSQVPPGTKRRRRGLVTVEYSRPDELADDHLIALLETERPGPAVLVSNDRDLQQKAAGAGATIASSEQLLALIR
jgi:predicted RNA-binding protein with PIN domain